MIIPDITPPIPVAMPTAVAVEPVQSSDTTNTSGQKDSQADSQTGSSPQRENPSSADKPTTKADIQPKPEELKAVQKLVLRDREVRAHEAAHKGAAGQYATSGARFTYTRGPDGKQYATGGEVSIDASVPDDPGEALRKAQVIRRAALAPAQPSGQDKAVASQAIQMETEARADLLEEQVISRQTEADPAGKKRGDVSQAYTIDAEEPEQAVDISA